MKALKLLSLFVLCLPGNAADHAKTKKGSRTVPEGEDAFLWLETTGSPKTLDWVRKHNKLTTDRLEKDPRYAATLSDVRKVYYSPDKLVLPGLRGNFIYSFWQDEKNERGLWRRCSIEEYRKPNPQWEIVLDLDKLAKDENENWVWGAPQCLPPTYEKCLLNLSRGGKDATVVREFDTTKKEFVKDGFNLPEAKSNVAWKDADTIWVGTDFGKDSMTESGYPRIAKLWKRGTPLTDAVLVHEGKASDISVSAYTSFRPEGSVDVVSVSPSFFESDDFVIGPDGKLARIPFPKKAYNAGFFQGHAIAGLRDDWKTPFGVFPAGAIVSIPADKLGEPNPEKYVELLHQPNERQSISSIDFSRSKGVITGLDNVKGTLHTFTRGKRGWDVQPYAFKKNQTIEIASANAFQDTAYLEASSFLDPSGVYEVDFSKPAEKDPKPIRSTPTFFDASGMEVKQHMAKSKDGTKIPYFVVSPKGMKLDGNNPTLLNAYGGFEVSKTPYYSGTLGKAWLAKNGVYVLANIRGGGEFGPQWHNTAIKENRQRAYDDFAAVAEDMIKRKITSPRRLGIEGASNGGLLTGVALTQRPELFNAVISGVPLLDMMRYHKLLAGSSWMSEYGNPEIPKEREAILRYSPYQNVKPGVKYPEPLFTTSSNEDRVHPSHARKMAALMESQGHKMLFYENIEGGHAGSANLEQGARNTTLEYIYLMQKLMD